MSRIAALLPSRSRPELCVASVRGLFETAARPADLEVLVRLDADDRGSVEHVTAALAEDIGTGYAPAAWSEAHPRRIHLVIGPRYTYYGLHLMFAELAAFAQSDWFLLWNDDARMPGNWDDTVIPYDPAEPLVLVAKPGGGGGHSCFPFISRGFVAAVRAPFAKHFCTDSYVCQVAIEAGCNRDIGLGWTHSELQSDRTGSELADLDFDAYAGQRGADVEAIHAYQASRAAQAVSADDAQP